MMTKEQKIIRAKVGLLELASSSATSARPAKMMGYGRDGFYRFKELSDAGGELALQELTRRKPILKNRTPPDVEAIIVELSLKDRPMVKAASPTSFVSSAIRSRRPGWAASGSATIWRQ